MRWFDASESDAVWFIENSTRCLDVLDAKIGRYLQNTTDAELARGCVIKVGGSILVCNVASGSARACV